MLALLIDAALEQEIRLGARAYAGAAVTLVGVAISLLLRRARSHLILLRNPAPTAPDGKMRS